MRVIPLAILLVCLGAAPAVRAEEPATPEEGLQPVPLRYKPARTWRYELPAEAFRPVGGALDFTAAGGARFVTRVEGTGLRVDTDGDGTPDVTVEGDAGYVRLRTEAGFDHAVRLRRAGTGWAWAASGARVGRLDGVRIVLIDQDGDGRHDGFGTDAMIVGPGRAACFLSRVVAVGERLFALEIPPAGNQLLARPFTGPTGRLDLAGAWRADARLESAVVQSEDGAWSFELAARPDGVPVPAGRYRLHGGALALGDSRVRFRRGRAAPIVVAPDATCRVEGGGPLEAEFAVQRRGDELVLSPDSLRWFGRAGEEYHAWAPFGPSPEFHVIDRATRDEIAKAIFTGC